MRQTASLLAKAAPSLPHHSSIGSLSLPMTIFQKLILDSRWRIDEVRWLWIFCVYSAIADSLDNGRELMIPLPWRPRCPPLQTTIVDLPVACLNICAITNGNVWPLSNLCVWCLCVFHNTKIQNFWGECKLFGDYFFLFVSNSLRQWYIQPLPPCSSRGGVYPHHTAIKTLSL